MTIQPFVFQPASAPAFWLVETLWTVLASGSQTDNRLGFMEQAMGSGLGPPTHRHLRASEGFYILEGACTFNAAGQSMTVDAGTFVHLPRLLPHSFSVESAEARLLNFYTPAGFEVMVMACGRPADERRRPTMPESPPPKSHEQIWLLSRLYDQEEVTALPFLQPSTPDLMRTDAQSHGMGDLVVTTARDVEPRHAFGLEWRCLARTAQTLGSYDLFEVTGPADAGHPPLSTAADQALYVVDGAVNLTIDGNAQLLQPGAFAYLPAGSTSSWTLGNAAKLLVLDLPGGFDITLEKSGGDNARLLA